MTAQNIVISAPVFSYLLYKGILFRFVVSFLNQVADVDEFNKQLELKAQNDEFDDIRQEYSDMLKNQLAKGNNGLVKTKYITFGVEEKSLKEAKPKLERIEADILNNFKTMGVLAEPMNGAERLAVMHRCFNPDGREKFRFSWDLLPKSGNSVKDFIAPSSFDFSKGNMFRMGGKYGAIAVYANGNVTVSGGEVSTNTGTAIFAFNESSTVTISGGTVSATTGYAILAVGESSTVTVSGGTVEATGDNGWAIQANGNVEISGNAQVSATTGTAIFAASNVTVSGGTISANTGKAIDVYGASSTVNVRGGLVFAYGTDIIGLNNVIYCVNTDAVTITSPGIVIAWNESAGITAYAIDANSGLIVSPTEATAVWDKKNVGGEIKAGINYANGSNAGFIPIDGITVSKTYTVTFNLNGGTLAAGTLVQMVEEGDSAIAPTATKDGYTFDGWDKAFNNITSAITITAKWKVKESGGGSGSSGSSGGGYTPSAPVSETETTVPVLKSGDKVEITIENGAQTVTYNGEALKEGKDFTIKDGKLIIDKDKLKELGEIGSTAKIIVTDNYGNIQKFHVKVTDKPRISAPEQTANGLAFNIAGYGNELRLIKLTDGEKTLKDFRIVSDINVRNGKFTLDSTAFSSLADGNYTLTATFDTGEKVSFTIIKKGDKIQFINADLAKFSLTGGTKPNTKDCLYFLEIFIGKRAYNGENLDFNADGKVNTLDVLVLLDFVVSM